MRRLLVIAGLLLGGCAQPSAGIDWNSFVAIEQGVGRMRAERMPTDAPLTASLLEESFRRIAFDLEVDPLGTGEPQSGNEQPMIRKWLKPMLFSLISTSENEAEIRPRLEKFAAELKRKTGHQVKSFEQGKDKAARLLIIYGSDDQMAAMSEPDSISQPDWDDSEKGAAQWLSESVAEWRTAPSPCAGYVLVGDERTQSPKGEILFAVIMIRKEVPDLLLDACIEEELSQAMGLLNDDSRVRPSIFNDDQEFALLTEHDSRLLQMLYDPRIEPGMSPDQAMPIVREILADTPISNGGDS